MKRKLQATNWDAMCHIYMLQKIEVVSFTSRLQFVKNMKEFFKSKFFLQIEEFKVTKSVHQYDNKNQINAAKNVKPSANDLELLVSATDVLQTRNKYCPFR